jgi:hypothetical protein
MVGILILRYEKIILMDITPRVKLFLPHRKKEDGEALPPKRLLVGKAGTARSQPCWGYIFIF